MKALKLSRYGGARKDAGGSLFRSRQISGVRHETVCNDDNIGRNARGRIRSRPETDRTPKARAQSPCTSASFRGAFGYTFTGITGVDALAFAAVGRWLSDGQGNFSGVETASSSGQIFQRSYTGTYRVNSDCTGSALSIDNFGKTVKCDFVIVSGGTEIQVIEADVDTAVVGLLRQQ